MKKVWLALAAVVSIVSCGGPEDPELGGAQGAYTYCGSISLTSLTTNSGPLPANWTGASSLRQVPLKVAVSANMPNSGFGATHTLDLGAATGGGGFRVDTSCIYKGKLYNVTTSQYEAALQSCTVMTPDRLITFDKARLQTSGVAWPTGSTTWSVTAQIAEILDDQNSCTADACGVAGAAASHTPITTGPGCTPLPPPSLPADKSLTANVVDDANGLFAAQGGTPGALDPKRAAIVRGFVYDTDAAGQAALAGGVTVSVLGHPELGSTVTRTALDMRGTFELAVNGGGKLTLSYQKAGTLGAQRPVELRWHEFRKVPDVQLVSHGAAVAVDASTGGVAQGATVSDSRGTRKATLFVPAGTSSPSIAGSNWNLRLTEFTVGADGARRMPGGLPDASAYTYAFAADIDEAGGAHVEFNQPVVFYVDDFVNIKVGQSVPVGSYDDAAGVWRGEPSDIVMQIVDTTGGIAAIDVTGDGIADTNLDTGPYAISTEERVRLAQTYSVVPPMSKKLIRARLRHFSKWDLNWGIAPPNDASGPNTDSPPMALGGIPCPNQRSGSILQCENQALAEELPITGTPFALRYQSDRTRGRLTPIRIPLTGPTAYPGTQPKRIDWKVNVAGREFSGSSTSTALNQSVVFTWDGLDAFNRPVQGRTAMDVQVGNTYAATYASTSAFGYNGNGVVAIDGIPGTNELTIWKQDQVIAGTYDSAGLGLGGWSLSGHHTLEVENGDVYLGSGALRHFDNAYRMEWIGGDPSMPEQDGVPARESSLGYGPTAPTAIAADPDGSIWFSYGGLNTARPSASSGIRRIRPDGIVEHIAGGPLAVPAIDGAIAADSIVYGAFLRVAPNGDIYVADGTGNQVWRITNESPRRVRLVAGTGAGAGCTPPCGDGGPATLAVVESPLGIAFDNAGNTYIAQSGWSGRVRKIDPTGVISTLFAFVGASGVELDGQGNVLVVGGGNIHRWPLGSSSTLLPISFGSLPCSGPFFLDGSRHPAFGCFAPAEVQVANNNATDFRRVGGTGGFSAAPPDTYNDNRLATQATLSYLQHGTTVLAPDGSIVVLDNGQRIRRLGRHPRFASGTFRMASNDGHEVYEFNDHGKHIRTVSALTGALKTQFSYDPANGLLTEILDGNSGLTTNVVRTPGQVVFQAPGGKNTTLTLVGTNNYLSRFTDASAAHWDFTMRPSDGLLTRMFDSRGYQHDFEYDPSGRVSRDQNAAGGAQVISSSYLGTGFSVNAKTAMGLSTVFSVTDQRDTARGVSVQRRLMTTPRNATYTSDWGSDGIRTTTEPNGTVTTRSETPDPRYDTFAPSVSTEVGTPAGLKRYTSESVAVTQTTPSDPFSIQTELRTTSRNVANCNAGSSCAMLQSTDAFDRATMTRTHTSAAGRTRTETFDVQERLTQTAVPGEAAVAYSYDGEGRVQTISQGARSTTMAYGPDKLVSSITTSGPSGSRVVTYTSRDGVGRPTLMMLPGSRQVGYTYDAAGNTTAVTPPSKPSHTQTFDNRDLMTLFTEPVTSATPTGLLYNADLQLTTVQLPASSANTRTYSYLLGLYSGVTGQGGISRALTRDAAERVTGISTGSTDNISLGFGYDGRLVTSVTWGGNVGGTVAYAYDNHFENKMLTVAGTAFSRSFDSDDLLTGVSWTAPPSGALTIGRNALNGRVETVTTGNIVETRTYDATYGELSNISYTYSGSNRYSVAYVRDGFGRVTRKTETVDALTPVVFDYTYDTAGFLAQETKSGPVTTTWGYDGNGNRTSLNGSTFGIVVDGEDRLTKYNNVNYTYDAATGNTLTRGTAATLTWDRLGNLRTVQQTYPAPNLQYSYDGQERRVMRYMNFAFTKWLYDGQLRIVAELDGNNLVTKRFVYGSRENVPDLMITSAGVFRLMTDQLGSVRRVVNVANGTSSQNIEYDAWGKVVTDSSPGFQPFGFAGGFYDNSTGLVHFGAREYDPNTGRWLSKDPSRWDGGLNFYAYAENDPVNFVDPTGRIPVWGGEGSSSGGVFGGGGAGGGYAEPGNPTPSTPCTPPEPPPDPGPQPLGCNCMCGNGTRYKASSLAKCLKYCAPFGGQCM